MIKVPQYDPDAPIVVIDIGNTTIGLATWRNCQVVAPISVATGDRDALETAFCEQARSCPRERLAAVVIASVVPDLLETVQAIVDRALDRKALVIGDSIPFPIDVGVTEPSRIGVDRVCGAFAAYDTIQAPCTVVSFGTCITVDAVDGDGVLLGGAILPGMRLQFRSMREHTAALPDVAAGVPELPYGRNTEEAMQTGVVLGIAGAIRAIVEGYASHLNRWPQVVATGGDAAFFQPHCDFIDTFVAHLTLRGVGLAYTRHLSEQGA